MTDSPALKYMMIGLIATHVRKYTSLPKNDCLKIANKVMDKYSRENVTPENTYDMMEEALVTAAND